MTGSVQPRSAPGKATGWLVSLVLATLVGCEARPARIDLTGIPTQVVDRAMHTLQAAVLNSKGETLRGRTVRYSVAPAGIAEVSPGGTLQCLKSGDATLTLKGGGLTETTTVRCRIPSLIKMPEPLRLVAGGAAVPVAPQVFDEKGEPLAEVVVPIVSTRPEVAEFASGAVRPVALGRATLRGTLGAIVGVTTVEVVERLDGGPLTLKDGEVRRWPLVPGTYLVTAEMEPTVKVAQGLIVSWEGASCPPSAEKPSLRETCTLYGKGTALLANPAQMGVGVSMRGTFAVERVPPPS